MFRDKLNNGDRAHGEQTKLYQGSVEMENVTPFTPKRRCTVISDETRGPRRSHSAVQLALSGSFHSQRSQSEYIEPNRLVPDQSGTDKSNRYKRVKYGVLLSILERRASGGAVALFVMSKVIPIMLLTLDFIQLYKFNAKKLQPPGEVSDMYNNYMFVYDLATFSINNTVITFVFAELLVVLCWLGIAVLAVMFLLHKQKSVLFSIVGDYMTLLTTLIFMPIIRSFGSNFICETGYVVGWGDLQCVNKMHIGLIILSAIGILVYVPLCLFISQNNFERDPNGSHILRRPGGRFAILNILSKTTLVFTDLYVPVSDNLSSKEIQNTTWTGAIQNVAALNVTDSYPSLNIKDRVLLNTQLLAWVHFAVFFSLLLCFRLLLPYHVKRINMLHSLFLSMETVGSICAVFVAHFSDQKLLITTYVYPIALVLISPVFAQIKFPKILQQRFSDLLERNFLILDLASDPSIPYNLGLDDLLKTATRCGQYAEFLHKIANDPKSAKHFYANALGADPNHATNLGKNADFLFAIGRHKEAEILFRRAMKVEPQHVTNLGMYARFLSLSNDPNKHKEADELYRLAVSKDPEHERYLPMYSSSSDGLFILNEEGYILDCNGTALRMFHGSTRQSMVGLMLLDMCFFSSTMNAYEGAKAAYTFRIQSDMYMQQALDTGTAAFMWTFQSFLPPSSNDAMSETDSKDGQDSPVVSRKNASRRKPTTGKYSSLSKVTPSTSLQTAASPLLRSSTSTSFKSVHTIQVAPAKSEKFMDIQRQLSGEPSIPIGSSMNATRNNKANRKTGKKSSLKADSFGSAPNRSGKRKERRATLTPTDNLFVKGGGGTNAPIVKAVGTASTNDKKRNTKGLQDGFSFNKVRESSSDYQMLDLMSDAEAKYVFQAEVLFTRHIHGGRRFIEASIRDCAKLGLLRENERQFVNILENLCDSVMLVDHFGTIRTSNSPTLDMFLYNLSAELENKNVKILIPKLESEYVLSGLNMPSMCEKALKMTAMKRDGTTFEVKVRLSVLQAQPNKLKNIYTLILSEVCPAFE